MKKKITVILLAVLITSFTLTGCMANPRQQLLKGIADLIMAPLKEAVNYDGYPEGVAGDIAELMQTQSHEMSLKAKVKELDMGQSMGIMDIGIAGAYLEIESAYDMETGDMAVDIGAGLGSGDLYNVNLFLKEDDFALDAGKLLPSMYVMAFDSDLSYKNPVKLQERVSDLMGQSGKDTKELVDELQAIVDDYVDFISKNLDKKWVSLNNDNVSLFGKSQKCNTVVLSIEGEDLQNLLILIFEKAQDDDKLASFLLDNFMSEVEDADDLYEDALDEILDALEDLDDDDVDDMAMEVTVYFAKNAPVALEIAFEDSETDGEIYWKYLSRGLEKDMEFSAAEDGDELLNMTFLNIKGKDAYTFELELEAEGMSIAGEGERTLKKDSETIEMEMDLVYDNGFDKLRFSETAEITWEAAKAGSEYEIDGAFSISGSDGTENIKATLTVSGDLAFSKTVDVDIDKWDTDAVKVDSFEELVDRIMTDAFAAFSGFGGLAGLDDFT